MDDVLFEQEGAVGRLILNRPDKRNALSLAVMNAVTERLAQIAADRSVQVLVLSGNGPAFCAGHDLKELTGDHDVHHYRRIFAVCSDMMAKIHQLPQPVIAQVHGVAAANGAGLVAACDLAIAADNARIGLTAINVGLNCVGPVIPVSKSVGRKVALEMLLYGDLMEAQEAQARGLFNKVVAAADLDQSARAWAALLAQKSPIAVRIAKRGFYTAADLGYQQAFEYMNEVFARLCTTADAKEGVAAFQEKRPPVWKEC